MLTLQSRYRDLVKITHSHESACNCVYCRRRRLAFGKLFLRNSMIFVSVAFLVATTTMIVSILSGSAIVSNEHVVLLILTVISAFCLGMLHIASLMK